ncbi:MAG: adenylosuccinate synthase [Thermoplasmata archaeon]|nr:adenylosuccinate synthase [Thermoplasmata archaeon]
MPVTVVVGAQFGDEGKGRITDFLASNARYVIRTGGGPNAGHTIQIGSEKVVLHQVSCGCLRAGVTSVAGPGMNIDPFALEQEIAELDRRNLLKGEILVSDRAHVILPIHRIEDAWEEEQRAKHGGSGPMGTTLRGIGPSYADRYGRWGVRFVDLGSPVRLSERLEMLYARKGHLGALPPMEELRGQLAELGSRLSPRVTATEPVLWEAIERGEHLLLEGAQSALLDVDFGAYPYVTSSHPTAAGALMGSGIAPTELDEVVGVLKAYSTRVGEGPFPTEGTPEEQTFLRTEGQEHGATTGRPRRCGWPDALVLRYAARVNGLSCLAITKIDILSAFDRLKLAVAYDVEGERVDELPADAEVLAKAKPVYEEVPGWSTSLRGLRKLQDLPANARRYIDRLEELSGVKVAAISVGPEREETIVVGSPF